MLIATRLLATEESGFLGGAQSARRLEVQPGHGVQVALYLFPYSQDGRSRRLDGLFGDRGPGHVDVEIAKVVFGERRFQSFFKFCFVRNPWDRLVSAFHYLRHGHPDSPIVNVVKASLFY